MTASRLSGIFDVSESVAVALGPRCARIIADLGGLTDQAALDALADPRAIHRALYRGLTPANCPELAGNFRGSEHPSLRSRMVFYSFNDSEGTTNIAAPRNVPPMMERYGALIRVYGARRAATVEERLAIVAPLAVLFGIIHPFADGNGHVQRITVECLIARAGFRMSPAWRIHPCPYGEAMHRALAAADIPRVASLLRRFVE